MCSVLRYRIIVSILCVGCLTGTAAAANLHFIILCDTLDPGIGTVEDLANSQDWARTIADNTGLTLRLQTLSGTGLTVSNTRATLNSLRPETNDVVYFYYSGHGGNPGYLKWPIFYFVSSPLEMPDSMHVSFDQVVQILEPKSPRLLIVVADACNSFPNQAGHPQPGAPVPSSPALAQALKDLFTSTTGKILMSGCKPGQYSYGSQGVGSAFSNSLINSVYTLAGTQSPLTWEAVLTKAAADTTAAMMRDGVVQEPQYEILTGSTDGGTTDTSAGPTPTTTPLSAPVALCGPMGVLPLAVCAMGLSLMRTRRRYD